MSQFVKKIEDLFEDVAQSVDFKPESAQDRQIKSDNKSKLTFPKILDFAFPQDVEESKVSQIGEVIYVGDGVVQATGLDKATIEEIIEIRTKKGSQKALILGIREDRVEAVALEDYSVIKRGDQVRSTGSKLKMPVGKNLLGRVVDPLGRPMDGKGPVKAEAFRDVEFPAPGVNDRDPVSEGVVTGLAVIDASIPIGKGQRELVVGDRKTGKSRTMLDMISNQKGRNVYCVYVGIGIQAAKAKATLELLEQRDAMKYTTLVFALADEPPTLQYISPYAGTAIAEHLMYNGKDVIIVYDDLSKQAKAYRQVSLLLKRSPGRDAYPGDIFFLHSRLLERASRLSKALSGGSITALPVAETQAGDLSDYIITNLMSITDGHIYLDSNMMHEGILPAVNSGASVSRIGSKVQTKLLAKVGELAGRTLARYNEVKSFETINTEVSDDTIRDIKRGKRVREILAQASDLNLSRDETVILLGIGTSPRMDHLELEHAIIYKENIITFYREKRDDSIVKKIDEAKKIDEINPYLDDLFKDFCTKFDIPLPPNKKAEPPPEEEKKE